jgi:hypothetical protein
MERKKTSVYLSEEDRERLARLAEQKGESQAWVLREALLAYDAGQPDKNYAMFRMIEEGGGFESPGFDDPQQYQDWLDERMRKGLAREYELQLAEARETFDSRTSN